MERPAVEIIGLTHRYGERVALRDLSLTVTRGDVFALLGPNGGGKSTLFRLLCTALPLQTGTVRVLGFDPFRDRKTYTKHIGVVFGQRTQLWWDIAVKESFHLLGKIYDVEPGVLRERLLRLSNILELEPLLHTPVRKLSLGERIRCDLAASLLHNPKVLFLDEPTIGLDAVAKDSIRNFLRQVNREFQTTIILTTHDLKEIEELCQRIIILDDGHIIYDGALSTIRQLPGLRRRIVVDFQGTAPLEQLQQRFPSGAEFVQESERRIVASYDPQLVPTVDIVRNIFSSFEVADLMVEEASIEEVVMKIYREGRVDQVGEDAA